MLTTGRTTDTIVDGSGSPSPTDCIAIDTVLLKVASRCNIDCKYCYVYHLGDESWRSMDKRMSLYTIDAVVNTLFELSEIQERPYSVVLHGGEPLLAGKDRLYHLISRLRQRLPSGSHPISVQTNGVLISDPVLDLFAEYRVSVAVSIDGPRQINDNGRVDHQGRGTFDSVLAGIRKLEAHPDAAELYAGVLAVIDPTTDPADVYRFFKGLNPPSIDFLYQDGNHSRLPPHKVIATSTEYGQWMAQVFDLYVADRSPIEIRVLDDLIKLSMGSKSTKEGLGVSDFGILIVETDGSIRKNDTLRSAYRGADRFSNCWNVDGDSIKCLLESRDFLDYQQLQKPTSKKCMSCPELQICGGGMTVHRWDDKTEYDNPTIFCADQLYLIGHIRKTLTRYGLCA